MKKQAYGHWLASGGGTPDIGRSVIPTRCRGSPPGVPGTRTRRRPEVRLGLEPVRKPQRGNADDGHAAEEFDDAHDCLHCRTATSGRRPRIQVAIHDPWNMSWNMARCQIIDFT